MVYSYAKSNVNSFENSDTHCVYVWSYHEVRSVRVGEENGTIFLDDSAFAFLDINKLRMLLKHTVSCFFCLENNEY